MHNFAGVGKKMKKQTIIALANSVPIAFIGFLFIILGVYYNNEYSLAGGLILLALAIIGGVGSYIYYSKPERLQKVLKTRLKSFVSIFILLLTPIAFATVPSFQNKEPPQKIDVTLPEVTEKSYYSISQKCTPLITFKLSNQYQSSEPKLEAISVQKFNSDSIMQTTVEVSNIIVVRNGSIFTIWIEVNNVTDFYSWTYEIRWNPSILELQRIIEGSFLPTWNFNSSVKVQTIVWFDVAHYTPGNLRELVGARLGDMIGADGSGIIIGLEFKAIREGYTTLSFFNGAWSTSFFKVSTLPSAEIGVLVCNMIREVKIKGIFEREGYVEVWLTIFWPFKNTPLSISTEIIDSSGRLIEFVGVWSSAWISGTSECMFRMLLPKWAKVGTAQLKVELWTDWKWEPKAQMYDSYVTQFEIIR